MKSFFEEYGFVMLAAVVIIALIGIAGSLKGTVETGIGNVMTAFENHIIDSDGLKNVN